MPEKATLYVTDLLKYSMYGLMGFIAWWVSNYMLPINDKIDLVRQKVIRLEEKEKYATDTRKRLEREINKLRASHEGSK